MIKLFKIVHYCFLNFKKISNDVYLLPNFFSEIKSIDQAIHTKAVGPLFKIEVLRVDESLNLQIALGSTLIDGSRRNSGGNGRKTV